MTGPIELSRRFRVDRLRADGQTIAIEAEANERTALAERLDLVELLEFSGRLVVSRDEAAGLVVARGRVRAELVQSCVVTLQPVPASLAFEVERWYGDGVLEADEIEVVIDPEAPDLPDPIIDGVIDLGELLSEELALAIDPYPRAAGLAEPQHFLDEDAEPRGPFGRLAALRARPN